ncbi:cell division inhibitor SepF [Acholeplasma morum]|jgi:cell division inhibitor SepF|uniref:cell division protein SepF n=1 Tax=Paracholeplasma morum TaxID=264637 RepID=UPI00195B7BDA|nr:cell division protein SepF [Paracholeplasma morum]MBM7453580.1 cell division inhibitor SepF [Paracholeplasma morum]
MAIFSKSKKEQKLPTYQGESVANSYDRIIFESLETDDDAYITMLARDLIDGSPLVLNFEDLAPDPANKIMAFLSGVIFTLEGQIVQINKKVFLFAREQDFKDGTLKQFIDDVKE